VLALLIAVVLALAVTRRVSTESIPALHIQRTLASYVRLPGGSPKLAWPGEGEAALRVEGVGGALRAGGSAPVPIASVAKVMTAYLTLLEHPLASGAVGFTITITQAEVAEQGQRVALGESTVAVRVGERLTERQALEALLLPSANNIAALIDHLHRSQRLQPGNRLDSGRPAGSRAGGHARHVVCCDRG
jgi:D-alanyl-D-alanine carboxypeptidase (penicillin-binding protein 5/6)